MVGAAAAAAAAVHAVPAMTVVTAWSSSRQQADSGVKEARRVQEAAGGVLRWVADGGGGGCLWCRLCCVDIDDGRVAASR